jgi:hypothetical protein
MIYVSWLILFRIIDKLILVISVYQGLRFVYSQTIYIVYMNSILKPRLVEILRQKGWVV